MASNMHYIKAGKRRNIFDREVKVVDLKGMPIIKTFAYEINYTYRECIYLKANRNKQIAVLHIDP